ncbi:MAG: 3-dehydroquinate synthase [Deltaproteobacteria bacterium]|nr:MAG: 3-dehydroquinate synthase [Deltaproteobacteria bacterium]
MTQAETQESVKYRGVPETPPDARARLFWFDARQSNEEAGLLTAVQHQGFDRWVVSPEQADEFRERSVGIGWVVALESLNDKDKLREGDVVYSSDLKLLSQVRAEGFATALYYKIEDAPTLEQAYQLGASHDYLVVELVDETNIPLELVVAELQKHSTLVLKQVAKAQEAEVSFGVVEHGADGALLQTDDIQEVNAVGEFKLRSARNKLELSIGTITRVEHLGMGHRACVDVTSLMTQEEGMLVGSTSSGGLLACSETHPLPYMDLRPFRVNAGAIHSYMWCPNNRTHYLSELTVGSVIQCVDVHGNARPVTVGRVKTEVRPLILLEFVCDGVKLNAIVQDDWHVRVYGGDGKPVSVTAFEPGSEVLCYVTKPGRHVGIPVDEQIIER